MSADDRNAPLDERATPAAANQELPARAAPSPPAGRLVFVDGLRGIGALGIALYHIWRYEPLPYPSLGFVPGFVDWVLLRSWFGVQFLLVVSGFVIALTLRNTWVTPRETVSFIGRRIVRLWPPYALTILIVLGLHVLCVYRWHLPSQFADPPTVARTLAHLAFLQDVLGFAALSAGIWTVCIEVQFYGVSVLGWGLAQRLKRSPDPNQPRPSAWAVLLVFAPLALTSLVYWNPLESTEPWVTHFLGSFFLGMVTWWALDRVVPVPAFVVAMVGAAVIAGYRIGVAGKYEIAIALTAALALFAAGRTGHLGDWLNWRWLQYFGRISYSLYLIHDPVSHVVMWWGWRWCDNAPTPAQSSLILLTCFAVSVAAAHLLYVGLEVPSGRWSARLKNRPAV